MEYIVSGYKPEKLFNYFEDICRIPHGSGNEEGIADMLCKFAKDRGLEFYRDEVNNVLIKKAATPDREGEGAILLQGHTDMVCEKNAGTDHDFLRDPLDIYVENGWLRARGTTLGGDDGAAVAMMMAILDDTALSHPALECLFTTGEETSMIGAGKFDYSKLSAKKIINLDSESEGTVTVSCAGACDLILKYNCDEVECCARPIRVSVKGLMGGHSGAEIHQCRANANRTLARILSKVYDDTPFHLVSISGGNKRNAIPREAVADIVVLDVEKATSIIKDEAAKIKAELCELDSAFSVQIGKGKALEDGDKMFTYKDTSAVLNMMLIVPNGVISMEPTVENFVRTSANLGVVATNGNVVRVDVMARSSNDNEMNYILSVFARIAKLIGAEMTIDDRHAGWALNPRSELSKKYAEIYARRNGGKEAVISGIHAGLECGIMIGAMGGDVDAISIGPDMMAIHTPDEALSLASMQSTYEILVEMLAN